MEEEQGKFINGKAKGLLYVSSDNAFPVLGGGLFVCCCLFVF